VDYTLIIPTFNRPSLLATLLLHLRKSQADFPIIILDSSAEEAKQQNAVAITNSGLAVSHQLFPEDTMPQQKFAQGFHLATTRYASLCPDDDILFVDGLRACVGALEADPTVAICEGVYLNFDPKPDRIVLHIEYDGPSVNQDSAVARMSHRLDRYEPATYSVFRADVGRKVFDACVEIPSSLFWELFTSLGPLAIGKHIRLPDIYLARRAGAPSKFLKRWHPLFWLKDDPEELFAHFSKYLKVLAAFVATHGNAAVTWRDVAFLHPTYFRKECPDIKLKGLADPLLGAPRPRFYERLYGGIVYRWKLRATYRGGFRRCFDLFAPAPARTLRELRIYCSSIPA
jgi:glycosyltransferase domain-containing protein